MSMKDKFIFEEGDLYWGDVRSSEHYADDPLIVRDLMGSMFQVGTTAAILMTRVCIRPNKHGLPTDLMHTQCTRTYS